MADELDFRVEAVHAKRAQEELDASFCTQCGLKLQEGKNFKDTSTITLFCSIGSIGLFTPNFPFVDTKDACRHLKGKVMVPKVEERLGVHVT